MSKIWQKHGFDRSQPYPKNYKKKQKKRYMRAFDHSEETVAPGGGGGHCMTSVHSVHTNNGEGEFFLPPNISVGTLVEARSKQMPSLHAK